MKAPDKIYIEIDNKAHVYFGLQPENAEEYIRKDALIEWLAEGFDWGRTLISVENLIDKLNSM